MSVPDHSKFKRFVVLTVEALGRMYEENSQFL